MDSQTNLVYHVAATVEKNHRLGCLGHLLLVTKPVLGSLYTSEGGDVIVESAWNTHHLFIYCLLTNWVMAEKPWLLI
ncbi:MAG: hypothetical protein P1R74_13990, partial [Sedimenticola sp.]|nr:hypothetical protein [Sedimenticola sp.]